MRDQDLPPLPPRDYLHDDAFMKEWGEMSNHERLYASRRARELKRGTAIMKDRMMGRPKNSLSGFYGLERAEEDVYRLEQIPREAGRLEEARRRLAKLQAALAEDAKTVEEIVKRNEEIEPYREYAAAQGKTLNQLFREYVEIENTLREDLIGGIFMICERIGVDPVQLLMSVHNSPDKPVTH